MTEITVTYSGYGTEGTLKGYLQYTLLHPCIQNVPTITFRSTNPLVEYFVCQDKAACGAKFDWTDTVSELSGTPNYCGVPVLEAIYEDTYSDDFKAPLSLNTTALQRTGCVNYAAKMCDRSLAVADPYKFKIRLSYVDGWTPITSTEIVSVKLEDPCTRTVWPNQKFFLSPSYTIKTSVTG